MLVEAIDLHKDYKIGKVLFPALRGIDIKIENGEFTAIAGPSGSGKTTLLNIIGCLDVPTKGKILIDGTDISELGSKEKAELRKNQIGFVFQTFNLIPVLTAYENVELPLILLDMKTDKREAKIVALLEEVGLGEFINRRPNEMSGGQQQRVAIARALVKDPSMVLADEPTANLDSTTAKEILALMQELNAKHKTTFIFSTHDQLVMDYSRRTVNLRDGRIVEDKTKPRGQG
ncbi:MAG: ABC transporter ATP-binding protein [candidate division WOR-3 bacterium]|nr:MAG: ABC transporter ATP-binding protein [candidate division WOR-3 bacterium]